MDTAQMAIAVISSRRLSAKRGDKTDRECSIGCHEAIVPAGLICSPQRKSIVTSALSRTFETNHVDRPYWNRRLMLDNTSTDEK
jgi:hypothetical protein